MRFPFLRPLFCSPSEFSAVGEAVSEDQEGRDHGASSSADLRETSEIGGDHLSEVPKATAQRQVRKLRELEKLHTKE